MLHVPQKTLRAGDIYLYLAFSDEIQDPDLLERYRSLLSPEESVQQQRYLLERVRHQDLITRALVRTALSQFLPVSPESWFFKKNAHGRPEISAPTEGRDLCFNLSHTRELVMLGVARNVTLGVDTENINRKTEHLEIATRFFSQAEVRFLTQSKDPVEQLDCFFSLWTLKEAYIKAHGLGLALPLQSFSFQWTREANRVRISLATEDEEDVSRWSFILLRPSEYHLAAIAVKKTTAQPLTIRAFRSVPLINQVPFPVSIIGTSDENIIFSDASAT